MAKRYSYYRTVSVFSETDMDERLSIIRSLCGILISNISKAKDREQNRLDPELEGMRFTVHDSGTQITVNVHFDAEQVEVDE